MTARLLRIGAVATLLASFGVWIYAFSGSADRRAPDLLDDQAWSTEAETICAEALDDVAELPSAQQAGDPTERSQQVQAATDRFAVMVTGLEQIPTAGDRDAQITDDWLADFRTLLQDRRRYAETVLENPAAPFTITDIGVNERLDKRITRFANTNSMPSCVAPTDV